MKHLHDDEKIKAIADAIRLKRDIVDEMTVDDMPLEIGLIESGGGDDGIIIKIHEITEEESASIDLVDVLYDTLYPPSERLNNYVASIKLISLNSEPSNYKFIDGAITVYDSTYVQQYGMRYSDNTYVTKKDCFNKNAWTCFLTKGMVYKCVIIPLEKL